MRISAGVTVPLGHDDSLEPVTDPEVITSAEPQFARGSEPFTRVDAAATRILTGEPRTRPASEPSVEPERYDLGGVIGRGGMGEVVAARDVQIGRDVAIKRLHAAKPSEAQLARFLREARIQGRLEHPAIPPVHEIAHAEDGRPYFAMRKLEGVTLADTLRDPKSPFTRQRLLRAFVDICHAIDLAHSRRIVHRDIKPSNILLGPRGEVFVLDWGIARELDAPDAFAGAVLGTPGYMAPEQARGDADLDERVDIFALGRLLSEILRRTNADPPVELTAACERAMQENRACRFSTVAELCDVVQRFLDGDRDLEQRRALARHHLTAARDAFLQRRDDGERRTIVMHEAGKALALDPTLNGAAELIGRIMLEPPTSKPAAVERELTELDLRGAKLMSRVAIAASLAFVSMLPMFVLLGIHDVPYLLAYAGVSLGMLGIAIAGRRAPRRPLIAAHIASMMVMFALLARMFSPLLISPALAAVTLVTISFNPLSSGRTTSIITTIGTAVSVLGVWSLEWIGVLPSSVVRVPSGLLLLTPVEGAASFPAAPVLSGIYLLVFCMAGAVGYFAQREIRLAREKLVLQAWHLRQLVP
ncbi:MAG TPA: serine/threonine-protein kinase [Kofleriaceae bacterium]|nr:serine/threonine-protein kinase [Kofleriaceae bacterium]